MLLVGKDSYNKEKETRFNEQNGKCKICGHDLNSDIFSNHLDHDHELHGPRAGRVRGLLCSLCNGTEGQIKHKFNRSGLVAKNVDMVEWLESLLAYHKQDTTQNSIHPVFIGDRHKWFNRLNREEMIDEMNKQSIKFELNDSKAILSKKYRKGIRSILKENKCLL